MGLLQRNCQKNYRILLDAMSRPGRVARLTGIAEETPFASALAIGRCLLDHEVSLCAIGNDSAPALQSALVQATGAATGPSERADFLFIVGDRGNGAVEHAKRGRPESPEEGATLIYCLEDEGKKRAPASVSQRLRIRLSGPGIAGTAGIMPEMAGIPQTEYEILMTVNADYPLGVDTFFVRPDGGVMALPRSTRIQVR